MIRVIAQLVARSVRDAEAGGSNPPYPNFIKKMKKEPEIISSTEKDTQETSFLQQKSVEEICALLAYIKDPQLIKDFFECLFTKAELKDFSNRWCLVKELEAGTTQREIAKKYGISLCNITRGSKEMKKENSAFKRMLKIQKELK